MVDLSCAHASMGGFEYSSSLERIFRSTNAKCLAVLDFGNVHLRLSNFGDVVGYRFDAKLTDPPDTSDRLVSLQPVERQSQILQAFGDARSALSKLGETLRWQCFECVMKSGRRDLVAVNVEDAPPREASFVTNYLDAIWPLLREDCHDEFRAEGALDPTEAFLWFISQKIEIGLMVFNSAGLLLRVNTAGRRLIESSGILSRSARGIVGATDADTSVFRKAVHDCAEGLTEGDETTVFLSQGEFGPSVPVTIARYVEDGDPKRLVVVVVPTPPDPDQIETIARSHGLSAAEAKAATLMQAGLTNREAAARAGLKEETFNTYAKRALSKLNVGGRTEMAQLLTWQSAGRLIQ